MSKPTASPRGRRGRRPLAIFRLISLGVFLLTSGLSQGQSSTEVRQRFAAIHDDQVPYNCLRATSWLFQHREALKQDLLDELYKPTTDAQSRDAIMHVLFNTASFVPDERFRRAVIRRLPEQDSKVPNAVIFDSIQDVGDLQPIHVEGVHWEAWPFIDKHFSIFEPLLKEQIGKTDNVFVLWATAWLFKKRGLLQNDSTLFTPAVLEVAANNLRADEKSYNASQAVRLFLLLGKQSLPTLQKAASSSDRQGRYLASATADALSKSSHDAFAYLTANLNLVCVPFGDAPIEPSWLPAAAEKYLSQSTGDSEEVPPYP